MSTLIALAHEASTHAAALPAAGGDGILDWASTKNVEVRTVVKGLAWTVGIVFVIWQAIASRGAMARIIIAGIAAAVFIWLVNNVTSVSDRVGEEVDSLGPPTAQAVDGPQPAAEALVRVGLPAA